MFAGAMCAAWVTYKKSLAGQQWGSGGREGENPEQQQGQDGGRGLDSSLRSCCLIHY